MPGLMEAFNPREDEKSQRHRGSIPMSLASAIRLAPEARKDPASISPCHGDASVQVALLPVTDRRDEQVKQDLLVQRQSRELFT